MARARMTVVIGRHAGRYANIGRGYPQRVSTKANPPTCENSLRSRRPFIPNLNSSTRVGLVFCDIPMLIAQCLGLPEPRPIFGGERIRRIPHVVRQKPRLNVAEVRAVKHVTETSRSDRS
jgi:hypothetical protein